MDKEGQLGTDIKRERRERERERNRLNSASLKLLPDRFPKNVPISLDSPFLSPRNRKRKRKAVHKVIKHFLLSLSV
jgi:hypothetical protein